MHPSELIHPTVFKLMSTKLQTSCICAICKIIFQAHWKDMYLTGTFFAKHCNLNFIEWQAHLRLKLQAYFQIQEEEAC